MHKLFVQRSSQSVESLIAFRFLQAIGGCVGMVAPNAIVRDVFPGSGLLILLLGHKRFEFAASQEEVEHQTLEMIEKH